VPHDVLSEFLENAKRDAETVREVIEASKVQEVMAGSPLSHPLALVPYVPVSKLTTGDSWPY
jgi:hypothetical protein